jgi:peptidoglycan/LPS O-acetylase OafA/YrhL
MRSRARFPRAGEYLVRRAARILPAYFACLTLLVILNRYWLQSDWPHAVVLHYALVFNYSEAAIFRINPPFWTLAVEVQFYLLVPLIFLLARQISARAALALVVALGICAYFAHLAVMTAAAGSFDPAVAAAKTPSPVLTYSLLAHLPHFLMGVAAGWIYVFRGLQERTAARRTSAGIEAALWVSAALVFVVLSTSIDEVLRIPYGRYNFPYIPALLCSIIVLTPLSTFGRWLLDSLPLRAIGTISYGVYIYHMPIQNAVARNMPKFSLTAREDWLVFGALSLALTLAVAAASYRILERPVIQAVRRKTSYGS